jgi:signal transduction histidine kinase
MAWREMRRRVARAAGRWRQDTFSKRLFLLLWATLVGSHMLGFALLHPEPGPPRWVDGPVGQLGPGLPGQPGPQGAVERLLMPPFLPPHALGGGPPDHPERAWPPELSERPPARGGPGHHSPFNLWLDYGARVLVLGLGAWLGARWLTAPMRKLAQATGLMSRAITQRGELPLMDERSGPVEVRQTAEVFNNMARHLHEQFEQRSLMMASVSHDLRTPLTRLRMRLERLQPDPEVARCVADVQDINAMIDAVLDAMNEERRHEPPALVDVLSLVQAIADDLQDAGQPVTAQGRGRRRRTRVMTLLPASGPLKTLSR